MAAETKLDRFGLNFEQKLNEHFQTLSREARRIPEFNCRIRAYSLANFITSRTGELVGILSVLHLTNEGLLPKGIDLGPNCRWDFHYAVVFDEQIWDPSYGEPVSEEDYLNSAFQNPEQAAIFKSEFSEHS